MKVIAVCSGGKDSTFNMMECIRHGHEIVGLINLKPPNSGVVAASEINIENYNEEAIDGDISMGDIYLDLFAKAMELPMCKAPNQKSSNKKNKFGNNDLFKVFNQFKTDLESKNSYKVGGISMGVITNSVQKSKMDNICEKLGVQSLAYLYGRKQSEIMSEMIQSGMESIIIKTAYHGLKPEKCLGKSLTELKPILTELETKFDCNVCGEGGEFESLTLDCPLFKKRIVIDESVMQISNTNESVTVGYLNFKKLSLVGKIRSN